MSRLSIAAWRLSDEHGAIAEKFRTIMQSPRSEAAQYGAWDA
jgi:hypothetical protein